MIPPSLRRWKRGDAVEIEMNGNVVAGSVLLALETTLVLVFEAPHEPYVGVMPVLETPAGDYLSALTGEAVRLHEPERE